MGAVAEVEVAEEVLVAGDVVKVVGCGSAQVVKSCGLVVRGVVLGYGGVGEHSLGLAR